MNDEDKLLSAVEQILNGDTHLDKYQFSNEKASRVFSSLLKLKRLVSGFEFSEDQTTSLTGQVWDRLQVEELLGQGGMGTVYRAYDSILDRYVALKLLNSTTGKYIDADRFVQEAQRMAQVRHPHIMAVYGAGKYNNVAAYWGELLQGPQLSTYLQDKENINGEHRLELALQLAEAVQAIHKKNLVHADIKLANIIVEQERGIILMDFGASVDLHNQDSALLQPSTPLAMAAEQFEGQAPTQASDVFSLGVVFCQIFCGVYPFAGDDFDSLRDNVMAAKMRNLDVGKPQNKKIKQLLYDMLAAHPADRPSIHDIKNKLLDIQRLPLRKARRNVLMLAAMLLVSITLTSLYSAYKTRQTNTQILKAQTETEAVNAVMEQILRAPATNEKGKDVLMLDVLKGAISKIEDNTSIPATAKGRLQYALAHSFVTLGEVDNAIELFQSVVAEPDSQPFTQKSAWIQLATHALDKREFEKAEECLQKANNIPEFETDWLLSEARLMASYANLYQNQQAFEKSSEYSQRSIALWDALGDHKDKTYVLILLAKNHMYLSNYAEAEKVFLQAFDHSVKHVGKRNINSIVAWTGAASVMSLEGKLDESLAIYDELIPLARDFLGQNSYFFYAIRFNFAILLTESGQYEAALQQQLELLEEGTTSGATEMAVIELKASVADQYVHLKRFEDAEVLYQESIAEATALTTSQHRLVFKLTTDYAALLNTLSREQESQLMLRKIQADAIEILGQEHEIVLMINRELAWVHYLQGEIIVAEQAMQKVLKEFEKKYGTEAEATVEIVERLNRISAAR